MKLFARFFISTVTIPFLFASCSIFESPESICQEGSGKQKVLRMSFNGGVSGYDSAILKSSTPTKSETSWEDGDKVYITFFDGDSIIPGEAVYSTSDGWCVSYEDELTPGVDLRCEVRYFVNTTYANKYLVNVDHNTEIYEALDGRYTLNGDNISVTATMRPKMGRMRFTGNAGDVITITGFSEYTSYSPANDVFSNHSVIMKLTVGEDGNTPYFYGFFTNDERLVYLVGPSYAYTRSFPSDILQPGDSGYVTIPTEESHYKWKVGVHVPVNGVTFKMLPVAGYGKLYLISETETTEAQYSAILEDESLPSSVTLPVVNVSYYSANSFINKLNGLTGLTFSLPSSIEWKHAADGGNQSQHYTYSGSNNPDDIAWYASNSGGIRHNVKTKAPNEIGLYDMSGNVSEIMEVETTNYNYRYYYYHKGGAFNSDPDYIRSYPEYSIDPDQKSPSMGFRVKLSFD